MTKPARTQSATNWVKQLAAPSSIESLGPLGARFVYSLRLIALHDRAKRDPIPELAARLSSVEAAAKALALAQAISSVWPENIHISRFCCSLLSHDERTIGILIDSAAQCDRAAFEESIRGLIRPERMPILWEAVLGLVAAEVRTA